MSAKDGDVPNTVFTVGHSTRPFAEFLSLLGAYSITRVVDIRTVPRSRHNPQYDGETLAAALSAAGVGYTRLGALGGFRRTSVASPNGGWRNASFRGFADYMQTAEFAEAIVGLIAMASKERLALMCAEAVPWRCHRSLVGDALLVRGVLVEEIIDETHCRVHELTSFAKVVGTSITYPPEAVNEAG